MLSAAKCINPTKLFTFLGSENQAGALKQLEKAAKDFENNPVLKRFGWNKDMEQFKARFIEATGKDPSLFVINRRDVRSFKLYTKQWTKGLLKGWDGNTLRWKVLQAKLRWLPNGDAVTSKIQNVVSYQRRHGQVNAAHIHSIRSSILELSKNFNGIDINYKKLEKLEAKVSTSPDEQSKRFYLKEIKEFLGAVESENVRTNAGDLINGIRDVMEGASPTSLVKRDMSTGQAISWSPKEQQLAQTIQDNWYMIRKDMAKVAVNALRTEIKLAKEMDLMEGGVRGLTKYLESLKNKIVEIEISTKKTAEPRKYDFEGSELVGMGIDTAERVTLNRDLGYMPHHVLDIMGHLKDFNNFMHSSSRVPAEQQFKEVVDWYNTKGNRPDRLKSRADGNKGYYSRNPLFFLQKYVHDIAKYNHDTQMKEILRETFDTLLKTKDFAKHGGTVDHEVNSIVDSGIMLLKGIAETSWIGGAKAGDTLSNKNPNGNWISKAVRGLTAFTFSRTMGLGIRSGAKNYIGGRLLTYIEHGRGMSKASRNYITNAGLENSLSREIERYGLHWERGNLLDQLTSEYNKAAIGKGSLEEGQLPPGLKEMITKDGKRVIVVADQTLFDKTLNVIESTASGAGIIHKHVENWLRPGVFREVYGVVHQNLMSYPQHWIEAQMGMTRASLGDVKFMEAKQRWVEREAGRQAYESVVATQFDYSTVSKADVLNTDFGKVLGQYQHYRFSLANYMKRTFDDGVRQIRSGNINSLESRKLARMGLIYPLIEYFSFLTGWGFASLAKNDVYEFVKNVGTILFTDPKTAEGQEKLAKSTHGLGASSLLGPNVSLGLEILRVGGLMHDNPTNKWLMLSMTEGTPRTESDFDRNMRIARLGNIELARWGGYILPSLSRFEIEKAIRTQFGLFQGYEETKSSRGVVEPYMRPIRDYFGISQPKWSDRMVDTGFKPSKLDRDDLRERALKSLQGF